MQSEDKRPTPAGMNLSRLRLAASPCQSPIHESLCLWKIPADGPVEDVDRGAVSVLQHMAVGVHGEVYRAVTEHSADD